MIGMEQAARKPFRLLPIIIVIYTVSFFLPICIFDDGTIGPSGAAAFVECLTCEMYPTFILDLPNVPFCIGLLCLLGRHWLCAGMMGSLALVGGVLVGILFNGDHPNQLASGYYAWLSSMALLVVAGFARSR